MVAKFPSRSPEKRADPVVYLAGGPGDIAPLEVNELIAAHKHAHNSLIAVERLSEEELRTLHARFVQLSTLAAAGANTARLDVDVATRKAG
jgi:hypothetical protein